MVTPIEFFAWVVIAISLVKILVILKNPAKWMDIVEGIWKNPSLVTAVSLILAMIVLYNLLQEITIVQMFSVLLFVVLLSAVNISMYSKEFFQLGRKILKDKKVMRKSWLPILIWVLLIIFAIKELI